MRSKKWIIPIVVLIVTVQLVVAFYAIPFIKLNNLLKSANNTTLSEIEAIYSDKDYRTFISQSDYMKMHIVEDELNVEEYAKVTSKKKVNLLSISSLRITCDTEIAVYTTESMSPIKKYTGNLTVNFVFKNGCWTVTGVNSEV